MRWRTATDTDLSHLVRAVEAEAWFEESRDLRPVLLEQWGRRGDLGILGFLDDDFAAAAWVRSFDDAPSDAGFVDPDTPVLVNAWVRTDVRRLGHGTTMLGQLCDLCRAAGHEALSVAPHQSNPAVGLYQRLGFEFRSAVGARWQMMKRLD